MFEFLTDPATYFYNKISTLLKTPNLIHTYTHCHLCSGLILHANSVENRRFLHSPNDPEGSKDMEPRVLVLVAKCKAGGIEDP